MWLPAFTLRPERLLDRAGGLFGSRDIDLAADPGFSRRYALRGSDESAIRARFDAEVRDFCHRNPGSCAEARGDNLFFWYASECLPLDETEAQVDAAIDLAGRLAREDEEAVLLEVESHTGLIHQTGYRRYSFVHLVIQEFLCAMHAQRTPNALQLLVPSFPDETALIAAYSSSADAYLEEVFRLIEPLKQEAYGFAAVFLMRLGIEGVDVLPSLRTGWVLLSYLAWMSKLGIRASSVSSSSFAPSQMLHFFTRPGAVQSLDIALAHASVERDRFGSVRIMPHIAADVPAFVSNRRYGILIWASSGLTQLLPAKYTALDACARGA